MKDFSEILSFRAEDIYDEEAHDSETVREMSDRATRISAANYHKADLRKIADGCTHLESDERNKLFNLLSKYEFLFDGTLGTWNTTPVDINLKEGTRPSHSTPSHFLYRGYMTKYFAMKSIACAKLEYYGDAMTQNGELHALLKPKRTVLFAF